MHFVKDVKYLSEYKLLLSFEDGSVRQVDLAPHLDGEVFEPLKDISDFKSVHLNSELETIVWKNGADMSPDFLYEISVPVSKPIPDGLLPVGFSFRNCAPAHQPSARRRRRASCLGDGRKKQGRRLHSFAARPES